jgi:hypothetical protein
MTVAEDHMRAIVVGAHGALEALRVREADRPSAVPVITMTACLGPPLLR